MNSSKLLRVGMPVLGICLAAALQSGCRSEVLSERTSVPPAVREMPEEELALKDDNDVIAPATTAAPASASKAKPASGKPFAYPKFEDTDHTPIYSAPKSKTASKGKTVAKGGTYTVVRGDSLSKIAARHKIRTIDLAKANNLQLTSVIRIGQKLVIPGGKVTVSNSVVSVDKSAAPADPAVRSGLYTVRAGDSIYIIAKRCKVKRADLMAANNLTENSILRVGQTLKLPGAQVVNEESVVVAAEKSAAPAETPAATAEKTEAAAAQDTAAAEEDILEELGEYKENKDKQAAATASEAVSNAEKKISQGASTEVSQRISIDDYCKNYGINKEEFLRINSNLQGKTHIEADTVVTFP